MSLFRMAMSSLSRRLRREVLTPRLKPEVKPEEEPVPAPKKDVTPKPVPRLFFRRRLWAGLMGPPEPRPRRDDE